MYQDSGLFLRGESGLGFATRRMERRMEDGVSAPGSWRSHTGAVLRLLPDRLAGLAAEVRAAAHPAHPAAADPEGAVREHVGALARAARPAGTVTDPATGHTLHVFRAPGRAGEMEIVTAPTGGPVFDIVAVRPAGMQGELEIYQDQAPGYMANGTRVRGARVAITWTTEDLGSFLQNPASYPNAVYVLSLIDHLNHDPIFPQYPLHRPRYVGQTADVAQRWEANKNLIRGLGANPQAPFTVWIGELEPDPKLQYVLNGNPINPQQIPALRQELLRRDTEHVLIRMINEGITWVNNNHPMNNGEMLLLTNQNSAGPGVAAPGVMGPGGILIGHQMAPHVIRPWFLPVPPLNIPAGWQFEL
jgi:hypothetical protein